MQDAVWADGALEIILMVFSSLGPPYAPKTYMWP